MTGQKGGPLRPPAPPSNSPMPRQLFNCNTAKPFALDQAADGKPPPEWVNILPPPDSDGKIYSRDFRVVQVDDLEDLARRSNALLKKQKGGAPVDLDHKLYGGWFDTGGGPVVAWAEEFRADTDGLHARVDWLKTGAEKVTGREYGYTSSVIDGPVKWEFDEDGWPTTLILHADAIVGFGLTNIPALETTRMFAAASTEALELETLRAFARKIGVPEGATPEQMRAAFKRFTAAPESGEIVDADGRAAEDADEADHADDASVEVSAIAGSTDVEALRRELSVAREELAKIQAERAAEFVDGLASAGKLTPAQRKAALKIAGEPGGLDNLRELYTNAPRVIDGSRPLTAANTTSVADAPHGVDPLAFALAREGRSITEITTALARRTQENKQR